MFLFYSRKIDKITNVFQCVDLISLISGMDAQLLKFPSAPSHPGRVAARLGSVSDLLSGAALHPNEGGEGKQVWACFLVSPDGWSSCWMLNLIVVVRAMGP